MKSLSIVVPAYNEADCIDAFVAAVEALKLDRPTEIIFVDDGSTDETLGRLRAAAARDARVRYVSFSRNFGKEAALFAGLRHATGDCVVTMDADLQHDPALLPQMMAAIEQEGYDSAAACRAARTGEPAFRSVFSHLFCSIMNALSDVKMKDGAMDYRMMTRRVVEAVLSLREANRFTKGIYEWVGFKTKWIETTTPPRKAGRSKWSFLSLLIYSWHGLLAFSTVPLRVASVLGFVTTLAAFAYMACVFGEWAIFGNSVSGWSTIVCLILLLGGMQLFVIGILGLYLAGIFRETKGRPVYVVKEEK